MDSEVRHIRQDGQPLLEDFLCEAVSVPDGMRTAVLDDADAVYDLVQRDVRAIYPSCYEPTIVEAFCRLHSRDAIATDIGGGKICVLEADGNIVATGTLDGNHVTRVFVLPELRGCGYGSAIMDELERIASRSHSSVAIDSSAPAEQFYLHRGYRITGSGEWVIEAEDGMQAATLVYKTMEKHLG